MKRTDFFPLERNHYFFGKLLTERDFIDEQNYFNTKRRLINRYVLGYGVVSGLSVIKVDEKTISLEPGLAIDASGREIVVDAPSLRRLTMIEGYDRLNAAKDYLYVCLAYDEEPAGDDLSLEGATAEGFSRYRETYRLLLTQDEPKPHVAARGSALMQRIVLAQDGGVLVWQEIPRLLAAHEQATTRVHIENFGSTRTIKLVLTENLELMTSEAAPSITRSLTQTLAERERVSVDIPLSAIATGEDGLATLSVANIEVTVDGKRIAAPALAPVSVKIAATNQKGGTLRTYYEEAYDRISSGELYDRLFLARIRLIHMADAYMIEDVQWLPFDQFVVTGELMRSIGAPAARIPAGPAPSLPASTAQTAPAPAPREAFGSVTIDLGAGLKRGQTRQSEEIVHGLGTGVVDINLELEADDFVYVGDRRAFPPTRSGLYALGARIDRTRGTFTVGVRALETTADAQVVVHWTARAGEIPETTDARRQLFILPEHIELYTYQSAVLSTVARNLTTDEATWRVVTPGGGTIDSNGLYTAPGVPGIYEIEATSKEDDAITNSTFVIVREIEDDA